jgi:CubicO group peptidase (beta-lactamase class C family)
VTGLLVARGDTILVERYQYARTDRQRLTSWSMAKTVTAMLVGIAIAEGHLRSVDDPAVAYVPALRDTEYGRTPLRRLLQMSSGVAFVEEYTGTDDVARLAADTFEQIGGGGPDAVRTFNQRARPSGIRFSYASSETQVLGLVLRAAVGRPVADYLREKLWAPIGAEADATWLVDRSGQEVTFCCLNAVLRDYARLDLLLAHGGTWRGRQIIPAAWIAEATRAAPDQAHLHAGVATGFFGYGYQVWIFPDWVFPAERGVFALLGVRGQAIFADPARQLVMVHTAVRKQPVDLAGSREAIALWRAVVSDGAAAAPARPRLPDGAVVAGQVGAIGRVGRDDRAQGGERGGGLESASRQRRHQHEEGEPPSHRDPWYTTRPGATCATVPRPSMRPPIFYGRWIVAAGFAIEGLIGALIFHAYGAYVVLLREEFGWPPPSGWWWRSRSCTASPGACGGPSWARSAQTTSGARPSGRSAASPR